MSPCTLHSNVSSALFLLRAMAMAIAMVKRRSSETHIGESGEPSDFTAVRAVAGGSTGSEGRNYIYDTDSMNTVRYYQFASVTSLYIHTTTVHVACHVLCVCALCVWFVCVCASVM